MDSKKHILLKISGFTLAEVLITIGIIGVVAALSIPVLIKEYQKTQTENQLKKAYAEFNQLFKNIIQGEDCNDLICTGLFDSSLSSDDFQNNLEDKVKKYMKIVQVCKNGDISCQVVMKGLKGNSTATWWANPSNEIVFVSLDGLKFSFQNFGCVAPAYPDYTLLKNKCSWIAVDINGDKLPNKRGVDAFGLGNVDKYGNIFPDTGVEHAKSRGGASWGPYYWQNYAGGSQCGEPGKTIGNSSATSILGQNCTARIIENNWKIDYWD